MEPLHTETSKLLSSSKDQLFAPLLQSDDEQEQREGSSALAMATNPSDNNSFDINMIPPSPTHRLLHRIVQMPTVADSLPFVFNTIVTEGKMSALAFIGVYLVILLLWLPFWLLTFVLHETGVYVLLVATVFTLGRVLIRLIAFPGSSHRVSGEIEVEFARYSVRMLEVGTSCLIELCNGLLSVGARQTQVYYEIPSLWKRSISYRDRVFGVYLDVLEYLYKETGEGTAYGTANSYGNNPISGDIGNLATMTAQARSDGKTLVALIRKVVSQMKQLEQQASDVLNHGGSRRQLSSLSLSENAIATARSLLSSATELRDLVSSLKPQVTDEDPESLHSDNIDAEADASMEAVRRHLEKDSGSIFDALRGSLASVLPLLDPQPHSSIFGLDVLRGSVLSRYRGARQLWVRRPGGGSLDVLHIPADSSQPAQGRRKAVLYCNPNAGLVEVATGMSLAGGNVVPDETARNDSWTDYYTQNGYDIFLFNYAGFGRSHGQAIGLPSFLGCFSNLLSLPGCLGCITRISCSTLFGFKPTPGSLRADASTMAKYVVTEAGFDKLIIHGESIGGLAASGAAKSLSHQTALKDKLSLLVCDRTFCNLEAVAQRLVGGWTGPAIKALAPLWSTDVASDFLAADCPKVLANDAEDAIIADTSSLKAGLSVSKEIRKGTSTKRIGWIMEAPLEYRMADWENVGVTSSKYVASSAGLVRPPTWPADKSINLAEAFHFAACARRVGKVATAERRLMRSRSQSEDEEGFEVDNVGVSGRALGSNPEYLGLVTAWKMLACCDGLSGSTLGAAVKNGYDCVVSWLCCTVTYGGQVVATAAQRRLASSDVDVIAADFDSRPAGYQLEESDVLIHPKPIPEVIDALKRCLESGDNGTKAVEAELKFIIGMLEYVVARLSSKQTLESSSRSLDLRDGMGAFIELHCGHNNPFSAEERIKLQMFLDKATAVAS